MSARPVADALALLDAFPERAAVLDDQGVIRALNGAWPPAALTGDSVGGRYLEHVSNLVGLRASDLPMVSASLRRLLDREVDRFQFDFRCDRGDGEPPQWCRLRARRVPGDWRDLAVLLVHEDINAWKDAERDLEQLVHSRDDEIIRIRRFQAQLIEFLPEGVIYLASDGAVLGVNQQGIQWLDMSVDELKQRKLKDFEGTVLRDDGSPCPVAEFPASRCLATGEPQPSSVIGVARPDGTIRWLLVTAVPTPCPVYPGRYGAVAVYMDITERKRAEEAVKQARADLEHRVLERTAELQQANDRLSESEAKFRQIAENIGEVVWIVQHEPRQLLYISPSYEKVFGLPAAEMYKDYTSYVRAVVPEDRPKVQHRNVLDFREPQDLVYRIHNGVTGELRWIRSRAFPLRDVNGKVFRVTGIAEDITDIKRAQDELTRLQQEVLAVTERERRGIGQDLHDGLGQQLTGVAFLSKSLQQRLAARAAAAGPVTEDEAREAADIARLVQAATAQSRALARGLHPVEANPAGLMAALGELASRTESVFRVPCTFECECPVPIHDECVANNLYRIAQEAVNNATKHASAGMIQIRLCIEPVGGAVTLTVSDDGLGIPAGAVQGTGMGLRIMRYRAGMIGGRLSVERRDGGGTVVRCVLPGAAAATAPRRPNTEDA